MVLLPINVPSAVSWDIWVTAVCSGCHLGLYLALAQGLFTSLAAVLSLTIIGNRVPKHNAVLTKGGPIRIICFFTLAWATLKIFAMRPANSSYGSVRMNLCFWLGRF